MLISVSIAYFHSVSFLGEYSVAYSFVILGSSILVAYLVEPFFIGLSKNDELYFYEIVVFLAGLGLAIAALWILAFLFGMTTGIGLVLGCFSLSATIAMIQLLKKVINLLNIKLFTYIFTLLYAIISMIIIFVIGLERETMSYVGVLVFVSLSQIAQVVLFGLIASKLAHVNIFDSSVFRLYAKSIRGSTGKWLSLNSVIYWASAQAYIPVSAWIVSPEMAGILRIGQLCFVPLHNIMTVEYNRTIKNLGMPKREAFKLSSDLRKTARLVFAYAFVVIIGFTVALTVFFEADMLLILCGLAICAASVFDAMRQVLGGFLIFLEKARLIFWARLASLIFAMTVALLTHYAFGGGYSIFTYILAGSSLYYFLLNKEVRLDIKQNKL